MVDYEGIIKSRVEWENIGRHKIRMQTYESYCKAN